MAPTQSTYLYALNYDATEQALCQLESMYLFHTAIRTKVHFSDKAVSPSDSAFIKSRLTLMATAADEIQLQAAIHALHLSAEGFKVVYTVMAGDETAYAHRLAIMRGIGMAITGVPNFKAPTILYGVCKHQGVWYFGEFVKNNVQWLAHGQKPFSFSNSLGLNLAKTLVNIAGQNNKATTILDACCGVGTILLEGCFAGYAITGCDINQKAAENARANLAHFNYSAQVHHANIARVTQRYDAVIIDLPYDLFTAATDVDMQGIITACAQLSGFILIVSVADITDMIRNAGLRVENRCVVAKKGKSSFARTVWVCVA